MTQSHDDRLLTALARDLKSRRQYRRMPKRMAQVMSDLMARTGYGREAAEAEFEKAWRDAVGSRLATSTRTGNLRRGVLEIIARNSAVVQELTFEKPRLLKTMKTQATEREIRDLRFRVGAVD